MATLLLQTAGSALGGALGGPLGAAIGGALGGAIGGVADQAILSGLTAGGAGARRTVTGPRLKDLDGISSTEGAPIPRVYGRARLGGQVIWATRIEEETVTNVSRQRGGKAVSRGSSSSRATVTTEVSYRYFASLAVGLCEGPIAFVRRIWADGRELDLANLNYRIHIGGAGQPADPLIVAAQGATPAYRDLAYVVFERLALEPFGNRIPQFTFEVVRPVHGLCRRIRAVDLIPGAGEHVYHPALIHHDNGEGFSGPLNRTQLVKASDWRASLDTLQALCPNLVSVALVVSWFGDDLRAGHCRIMPRTEPAGRDQAGVPWRVAGLTRTTAPTVSLADGRPAFGGTPTDASVVAAIQDLKARGLSVVLYPFVMMDVPPGNGLPDPQGAAEQPAYPWRGRITCHPARGRPGSPEGTAGAGSQVAAFFGSAQAAHFGFDDLGVTYGGPPQWSLSRMVLHMAALAFQAGGVSALVLGSELVGLTRVSEAPGVYPAAWHLKALAAQVRALVGGATLLTYGADWTEYGADVRDGGSEVRFPLDPFWADPNVEAVGIDWYPPLSDWRDGESHLDAAGASGPHDPAYLAAGVAGGEAYDWHYPTLADRMVQNRVPITDGGAGKPWVFRQKDLAGWWQNAHRERAGGVELASPTAWVPAGKPIWLLEIGAPAVDRAGNGPNVFPDPKSADGGLPPFSRGGRDDLAQARCVAATIAHFDPADPGFLPPNNPVSPVYGGRMVDPARIHVWCWDARPFPAFPMHGEVWADGHNMATGHWLNGRLEGAPAADVIAAIAADLSVPVDASGDVPGFVDGYTLDRPMSARAALAPLLDLFGIVARPSGGTLRLARQGSRPVAAFDSAGVAVTSGQPEPTCTRAQETDTPAAVTLAFTDSEFEHRVGAVRAQRAGRSSRRELTVDVAAALPRAAAAAAADSLLARLWAARETVTLALPPSALALEPADIIRLTTAAGAGLYRIDRITDAGHRLVVAGAIATHREDLPQRLPRRPASPAPALPGRPLAIVLDLPAGPGGQAPATMLAVHAEPFAGYGLWRSTTGTGFSADPPVTARSIIGRTLTDLPPGSPWRTHRNATLDVELLAGSLHSVDPAEALGGQNWLAVGMPPAAFEILSFDTAELTGPRRYRLSGLVRGLAGSEPLAVAAKGAGQRVVLLDGTLSPLAGSLDEIGRESRFRLAPLGSDHADPAALAFSVTPGPVALLPPAPVHARARRSAAGVTIGFVRRARAGGDSLDIDDPPLGEEREAYLVEILAGPTVLRRFEPAAPTVLYAAADELADFGAPQTTLSVRISQSSRVAGQGHAMAAVLPVT
jgi:hypothetical protein